MEKIKGVKIMEDGIKMARNKSKYISNYNTWEKDKYDHTEQEITSSLSYLHMTYTYKSLRTQKDR